MTFLGRAAPAAARHRDPPHHADQLPEKPRGRNEHAQAQRRPADRARLDEKQREEQDRQRQQRLEEEHRQVAREDDPARDRSTSAVNASTRARDACR